MDSCCSGTASCGCGQGSTMPDARWIRGTHMTSAGEIPVIGEVPVIETTLTIRDRLDSLKARWGIGRMELAVAPGLYAVGNPGKDSHVFVTANYKPSFDSLREQLGGMDAWVLILDTKGINVWCAAGKGTFGTEELVRRIGMTRLKDIVSHRTIILPQLAAPGVAGQYVKVMTGFRVVYGPVRARDIKPFLENGMKADSRMRTVDFGLTDRLAVVPVELMMIMKYMLIWLAVVVLWSLFSGDLTWKGVASSASPLLGAMLMGVVGVPALLPLIPLRSFALKGWALGAVWTASAGLYLGWGAASFVGNILLLPVITAFLALNFTGSTTFTSQTGVNREIGWFARPMAVSALCGAILLGGNMIMGVLS